MFVYFVHKSVVNIDHIKTIASVCSHKRLTKRCWVTADLSTLVTVEELSALHSWTVKGDGLCYTNKRRKFITSRYT
jgi:hypothetical protein